MDWIVNRFKEGHYCNPMLNDGVMLIKNKIFVGLIKEQLCLGHFSSTFRKKKQIR
jgi:hypothetical protein